MNVKMGKWQLLQALASFFFLALLIIQASSSSAHEGEEELQVPSDGDRTLENAHFEKLQAALLALNAQKEDLAIDDHNLAMSLDGAKGSEVIGLLQNYAHHLQQKWQQASGDGAAKEVQAEEEEELLSHRTLTKQGFSEADYSGKHSDESADQEPVNVKSRTTAADEERDDETLHQSDVGSHTLNPDVEARDRLHKLEESLKAIAARSSPEQGIDEQSFVMSAEGVAGHEVINLLHNSLDAITGKFTAANGKPSPTVVDALAAFGAGAMLGDAFLHQLPHAFGYHGHSHPHGHSQNEGHGHSMQDLSVGLAILGGILLFFIVEKIVRRVEELSCKTPGLGHAHHHHSQKKQVSEGSEGTHVADGAGVEDKEIKPLESNPNLRKRTRGETKEETSIVETDVSKDVDKSKHLLVTSGVHVMGYLNLFSDAVHNFTDGMSLGTAFLLHGTVGGWSRTLFLLAHELPQEVGDFGILVRSGFSVFKALAFNFLSALVAMAGTALALSLGGNPGHSSLIEGFTAGGFIYISVAGVMPDMHTQGNSLSTTLWQLTSMILGMGVAVVIALAE
ncbi:unnamed protein product [Sphagnum jensenii]|uniref:IAA-alanine resistance protein 1 n=1 Tax=Sphagnum jensenii TaxID=128206 RepID=A0ABP1BQR0_9BRYO